MSLFGNLGNLSGMMKEYQNMKQKAEELKIKLAAAEFSAVSLNGNVRVTVSGLCDVKSVTYYSVAPSQDDIAEAANAALALAKQNITKEITEMTGGIPLPGLC